MERGSEIVFHTFEPREDREVRGRKFRCSSCGTADTPERRVGPSGRRTLCNRYGRVGLLAELTKSARCGLRFAKQQKSRQRMAISYIVDQVHSENGRLKKVKLPQVELTDGPSHEAGFQTPVVWHWTTPTPHLPSESLDSAVHTVA